MKKSKFVGKTFDNGWHCTGCNLAANYSHGTRHNRYWYAFERTTDLGERQWFRVEAHNATKIYKGILDVQDIYLMRIFGKPAHTHEINYIK